MSYIATNTNIDFKMKLQSVSGLASCKVLNCGRGFVVFFVIVNMCHWYGYDCGHVVIMDTTKILVLQPKSRPQTVF